MLVKNEWISRTAACKQEAVGTQTNLGDAQKTITKAFKQVLAPDTGREGETTAFCH